MCGAAAGGRDREAFFEDVDGTQVEGGEGEEGRGVGLDGGEDEAQGDEEPDGEGERKRDPEAPVGEGGFRSGRLYSGRG